METITIAMATVERLEAYQCDGPRGTAAMTRKTAATVCSPTKSKHPTARHDESDCASTAYSSWNLNEDGCSSQLSSPCLTFRSSRDEYDGDDDNDDDDDPVRRQSSSYSSLLGSALVEDDSALPRQMSFNSSYFSAVTSQDDADAWEEFHLEVHPFVVVSRAESRHPSKSTVSTSLSTVSTASTLLCLAEDDAYLELAERAGQMLRKESEHEIHDYFDCGDASGKDSSCSYSPIDASCRAKMMEWSFRVVEYSFPLSPSAPAAGLSSIRKHSTEAIQIVSQVFNLVDRLSSLHYRQSGGRAMDRSEYKLTCMACLHLVAKTCGLFRLYDSEKEMEEERPASDCDEDDVPSSADASPDPQRGSWQEEEENDRYYIRESASMLSFSSPSSQCGQTIVPTPNLSHASDHGNGAVGRSRLSVDPPKNISLRDSARPIRPRPPLDLLSLAGLSMLCRGEYTTEQLARAERNALQRLDWKLTSATSVDWLRVLLDAWVLVRDESRTDDGGDGDEGGRGRRRTAARDVDVVEERSLACLDALVETNWMVPPSLAAWAAVARSLDECDARRGCEARRFTAAYRDMVRNTLLPYCEEELDAVRS